MDENQERRLDCAPACEEVEACAMFASEPSLSRSRHTDPLEIRAARRIRDPRQPRGEGDLSRDRNRRRIVKEAGLTGSRPLRQTRNPKVRPRIVVHKARRGFAHPVSRQDIRRALEAAGPKAVYGLELIELSRAPDPGGPALPQLGRLFPRGRIVLFEQSAPPWHLRGWLSEESSRTLETAGAIIARHRNPPITIVEWPGDTLRDFMLFDVFLHELGHHILQHNKGKRPVRSARSRDHEAFAERFARSCRKALSGVRKIADKDKEPAERTR